MTHEGTALAHRTAWSMIWAFAATGAGKLISLASIVVLTRFLAPESFGLLAFASLFVTYLETVSDLGSGTALVYWPSRREDAAQVSFVLNVMCGWVWFALAWWLAPTVGGFFGNPAAVPILRTLAWSFPIRSLGNTHDALLRKDLRFRARLLPDVGLAGVKGIIAILLAWRGFSIWSLVWGQIAGLAVQTVLLWIVVDWRPRLAFPWDLVKPMTRYGRAITAVNVLAAVVHHVDLLVVGKLLGATALGLYQIATKLPDTTIGLIILTTSRVLFPTFSRAQAGRLPLSQSYLTALRYVSLVTVPWATCLAFLAEPLVTTLFGHAWRDAGPILAVLGIATCFRSLGSHAGDVLKATGRAGILAGLGVCRAVVLIPVLLLVAESPLSVALGVAFVSVLTSIVNIVVVCRLNAISLRAVGRSLRSAFQAAAVLAGVLLASRLVFPLGTPAQAGATFVVGILLYLVALRMLSPDVYTHLTRLVKSPPTTAAECV